MYLRDFTTSEQFWGARKLYASMRCERARGTCVIRCTHVAAAACIRGARSRDRRVGGGQKMGVKPAPLRDLRRCGLQLPAKRKAPHFLAPQPVNQRIFPIPFFVSAGRLDSTTNKYYYRILPVLYIHKNGRFYSGPFHGGGGGGVTPSTDTS